MMDGELQAWLDQLFAGFDAALAGPIGQQCLKYMKETPSALGALYDAMDEQSRDVRRGLDKFGRMRRRRSAAESMN